MSRFRLAYSEDCTNFLNILDGAGNNAVINMFVTISFKQQDLAGENIILHTHVRIV